MKVSIFFDKTARFLVDPIHPKNRHPKLAIATTTVVAILTLGIAQAISCLWRSLRHIKEKNKTIEAINRLFHKTHPKPNPIKNEERQNSSNQSFSQSTSQQEQTIPINNPATSQQEQTIPINNLPASQQEQTIPINNPATEINSQNSVPLTNSSVPTFDENAFLNDLRSLYEFFPSIDKFYLGPPPEYLPMKELPTDLEPEYVVYFNSTGNVRIVRYKEFGGRFSFPDTVLINDDGNLEVCVNFKLYGGQHRSLQQVPVNFVRLIASAARFARENNIPLSVSSGPFQKLLSYFEQAGQSFSVPYANPFIQKYQVSWDETTKTVLVQNGDKLTKLQLGPQGELLKLIDQDHEFTGSPLKLEDIPEELKSPTSPLGLVLEEIDLWVKGEGKNLKKENISKIYDYFAETQSYYADLGAPFSIKGSDSFEYEVAFNSDLEELQIRRCAPDSVENNVVFKFADKKIKSVRTNGKQTDIKNIAHLGTREMDLLAEVLKEVLFEEDLSSNLMAFQAILDEVKKNNDGNLTPALLPRNTLGNIGKTDSNKNPDTFIRDIPLKLGLPDQSPENDPALKHYLIGWFATNIEDGLKAINFQNQSDFKAEIQNNKLGVRFKDNGEIVEVMVDGQKTTSTKIPYRFYPYMRAALKKAFIDSSKYLQQGNGILIHVLNQGLFEVSEQHLRQLNHMISQLIAGDVQHPALQVQFLQSNLTLTQGSDMGGLRREYLDSLTRGIIQSKQLAFGNSEEGKIPLTQELSEKNAIGLLTVSEKDIYKEFGKLMMFCYHSKQTNSENYTLGNHLNPLLFQAILSLTKDEILTPFEELTEETQLKICKALIGNTYSSTLLAYLNNPVVTDEELKNISAMLLATDSLARQFIEDDEPSVDLIKQNLAAFRQNVIKALFAPSGYAINLGRQLAPVHAIAAGMLEYHQSMKQEWGTVASLSYHNLSDSIQGHLDRETIADAIVYSGTNSQIQTKVQWLKNWIKSPSTSMDDLRLFLKFSTGVSSLDKGNHITVQEESSQESPIPASHTCGKLIDLSPKKRGFKDGINDYTEENFYECIRIAIQPSKTAVFSMG